MESRAFPCLRKNVESSFLLSLALNYSPDKLETCSVIKNPNKNVYQLLQDVERAAVEIDSSKSNIYSVNIS